MKLPIFLSLFVSLSLISCQKDKTHFNIKDFGAVGDSLTINTQAIQKAIDHCSSSGGGTVIIPDGNFITGTILLKDSVTLHLEAGANLLGSKNPLDYKNIDAFTDATGQERGKCLIGVLEAKHVGISGNGIINGRGELFLSKNIHTTVRDLKLDSTNMSQYTSNRPFLIRFVRSSEIKVNDVHLRQPAAWTCHFYQCQDIHVEGITIYSHAHSNNDGIDLDSSNDAVIKNCTIDSGDDAICFKTTSPVPCYNIMVSNCKLKSHWGTIKFGTESMGDFTDITIKNCFIHETRGGGIKILSVDGANISNILIDSIRMERVDMPVFIRLGERLRTYREAPVQEVGSINNITISNVVATTWDLKESRISPPSGVFLTGTPDHKLGSIKLENVRISLPGGGIEDHAKRSIEEQVNNYPEFSFFGILPSYGIFARHIDQLQINEMEIETESEDKRPPFLYSDIKTKKIKGLKF